MWEEIIISNATKKEVNKWRSKGACQNLILQGPAHVGKGTIVKGLLQELIGVYYKNSCDYHYLESQEGKIKVDDIRLLLEQARVSPVEQARKVFVIDNAGCMGASAQNALLKVLEDGSFTNVFILITTTALLDTVHSRGVTIQVTPLLGLKEEDAVLEAMSEGRVGMKKTYRGSALHSRIQIFDEALLRGESKVHLLNILGALKEKDGTFFYDVFSKEEVGIFYSYLLNIHLQGMLYELLKLEEYERVKVLGKRKDAFQFVTLVREHQRRLETNNYSKNDFLELVFALQVKEGRKG